MRNRAKCKLCNEIIESFHVHDFVSCKCGEISIDGGTDYYKAMAKDWVNFLRVDDDGKETEIKVVDQPTEDVKPLDNPPLTREEKLKALDDLINSYEKLPQAAMMQAASNYDILSVLLLVKSLLSD